MRDLTRYRMKTVQARTSEIQRLGKALESAGIKLGSVASDITGKSATAMIEALIDGERRGGVLADLAMGRMRTAGKLADLSMALAGRFTEHHALLCRLHRDRITLFDEAVAGLDEQIARRAARWQREADLLRSVPGFGDVVARAWLGEIGPAPHRWFASHEKLASWVTLCPGNNISARKRKHGRTGDAGTYIKPMLIQAAWAAIRTRAGCRPGTTGWSAASAGTRTRPRRRRRSPRSRTPCSRSPTRSSRAGTPYNDLGADFYTRRESPEQRQAWLERQLQKLHPGCVITITISPAGGRLTTRQLTMQALLQPAPEPPPVPAPPAISRRTNQRHPSPRHRPGQGPLPRAHRDPVFVSEPHSLVPGRGPGRDPV